MQSEEYIKQTKHIFFASPNRLEPLKDVVLLRGFKNVVSVYVSLLKRRCIVVILAISQFHHRYKFRKSPNRLNIDWVGLDLLY